MTALFKESTECVKRVLMSYRVADWLLLKLYTTQLSVSLSFQVFCKANSLLVL